jgi:hypothetical protein
MLKTEHNFFYQLMSILFDIQNCGLTEQVEKPNRSASYGVLDGSDASLIRKEIVLSMLAADTSTEVCYFWPSDFLWSFYLH